MRRHGNCAGSVGSVDRVKISRYYTANDTKHQSSQRQRYEQVQKKKQETKHFTQEGNINNKKRKNVIKSVLPLFYTLQTLSD